MPRNMLDAIPSNLKGYLVLALVLSGLANCLMMAGAVYTLQVYDRVLTSKSVATLLALSLLVVLLYTCLLIVDLIRHRIMSRIADLMDAELMPKVVRSAFASPMIKPRGMIDLQHVRDADGVRGFLGGAGAIALFDLPWIPVYLGLVYALSPDLALATTAGMLALILMAWLAEGRR